MPQSFQLQIARINQKLSKLQQADPELKVFGARGHEYHRNPPMREDEVQAFETKYGLTLPECYRVFLLQVGDSSATIKETIAGPYYGLHRLGVGTDDLVCESPELYLKMPCLLSPAMSDSDWEHLTKPIQYSEEDEEFHPESEQKHIINVEDDYLDNWGKVFGGLLPLGTQGCTYYHALVLNGDFAGRVVNVNIDLQKPQFAYEANFLDWYERYLDEVLSGQLLSKHSSWFGYQRGDSLEILLSVYEKSSDRQQKQEALTGIIYKKPPLPAPYLDEIERLLALFPEDSYQLLQILTLSDYERAKPYLTKIATIDLKPVVQFLHWYYPDKKSEWVAVVKEQLPQITDEETFRFATYTLTEQPTDFGECLLPFTSHPDPQFRITAFYTLNQSLNKENYLPTFIKGLEDTDNDVLRTALQATYNIHNEQLLPYYQKIAKRFPTETDYILSNLEHCLKKYELTIDQLLKMKF